MIAYTLHIVYINAQNSKKTPFGYQSKMSDWYGWRAAGWWVNGITSPNPIKFIAVAAHYHAYIHAHALVVFPVAT